jgi:hypothetical protein
MHKVINVIAILVMATGVVLLITAVVEIVKLLK